MGDVTQPGQRGHPGNLGYHTLTALFCLESTMSKMAKKAFLACRNAYASGLKPLRGCVNDVYLSKDILRRGYCFGREDVKHLVDVGASRE